MAAYVIRKDIDPQITFGVMAVLILLSVIFIYFFGLPRKEDTNDPFLDLNFQKDEF